MFLLARANWQPGEWLFGTEIIHIARGELITTLPHLVEDIPGTSIKIIRTSLKRLSKCGFLGMEKGRPYTHIKLLNYDYYENSLNYEIQKKADKQAGEGQVLGSNRAIIEEGKEGEEGKERSDRFEVPKKLIEEYGKDIVDICFERLKSEVQKGAAIKNWLAYLSESCRREAFKRKEENLERTAVEDKKRRASEAKETLDQLQNSSNGASEEERLAFADFLRKTFIKKDLGKPPQ